MLCAMPKVKCDLRCGHHWCRFEEISSEQAHRKPLSNEAIATSDFEAISRNSPVFLTLLIKAQHKE